MKIRKMPEFLIFLTRNNIVGITLAPFGIYVKEKYLNYTIVINHEKIHWKQQVEMLIIFFYLWYLIEWIIRLIFNYKSAYKSISFEKECYENENNLDYIKTRKRFSWFKYI